MPDGYLSSIWKINLKLPTPYGSHQSLSNELQKSNNAWAIYGHQYLYLNHTCFYSNCWNYFLRLCDNCVGGFSWRFWMSYKPWRECCQYLDTCWWKSMVYDNYRNYSNWVEPVEIQELYRWCRRVILLAWLFGSIFFYHTGVLANINILHGTRFHCIFRMECNNMYKI